MNRMNSSNPNPHPDPEIASYFEGMRVGMRRYAWWKDGTQFVGTCGQTLSDAIRHTIDEENDIKGGGAIPTQ